MSNTAQPKATGRLLSATKWQIGNGKWELGRGRASSPGEPRVVAAMLLLMCALSAGAATTPLRLEPTVTEKEAKLLENAVTLATTTNTAQAIALLDTKARPKASAALDFAIGNFYFQSENYKAATEAYRHAITKLPTFRNARRNLGRVHLLMGQEKEAIHVYQALVEEGLGDADTLLLLGHGLIGQSHYVSAENAYRQLLLLKPTSLDAQQGLVKCLLQQERYREARSLLKNILSTTPTHAELWSLLANVNMALDNMDNAICALETARRLELIDGAMLSRLGDLYLNRHQPTEAITHYEAALAAGWNQPHHLLRAVEGFIQLGDAPEAKRMLERMGPPSAETELTEEWLRLNAELAALEGRYTVAIEQYRKLISQNPLHGHALLKLGDLLMQAGDPGGAELAYERAGRLEGMRAEALVRRAQLAVQRNQFTQAVTLLEGAQALTPQDHVARYLKQVRRLVTQ